MRLNDLINTNIGRYRVEALIGRGGMAAVYRAFDTRLERHVALKVLYPQFVADPELVERFRREAITAAQLDHPNIAPIFDVGEADGLLYLAMKLLPGPSLAELLQREGRLPPDRVVGLAYELAAALDEAHGRGIVHRDIKPGNVLLDERGRAVLTDFGIAKSLDAPSLTESSVIVGTPDYIAPEQIDPSLAENGRVDLRADLYALGALLYRALTGRRPFEGSSQAVLLAHLRDTPPPPSTVLPELGAQVDAVFATAMARRPAGRFASATQLAVALGDALGERTAVGIVVPPAARSTQPLETAPAAPRPVSRRRVWGMALAALPAVLLLWLMLPGTMLWGRPAATESSAEAVAASPPASREPGASATATRAPTRTARPTRTAEPSATSEPSPTAEPSSTVEASPTAAPATATVEPAPEVIVPVQSPPRDDAPAPRPEPTSLPRPSATPEPPTAEPTPVPTTPVPPTPVPPTSVPPTVEPTTQPTPDPAQACDMVLAGGFGHLWRTNAAVREGIGCPLSRELAGYSVEQLFQGGVMYWRESGLDYWVMSSGDGTWRHHTDVYAHDPEPEDQAPDGLYTPVRGFGKLWNKYPAIRESLGWGVTPETAYTGVLQSFERGTLLWTPAVNGHTARIYVLFHSGVFASFDDVYAGP